MTTIPCKPPEVLAAQLDVLAREEHGSKSAVLREALEAHLKRKRGSRAIHAFNLAKHLRGSIEGGPSDLATNPELPAVLASTPRVIVDTGPLVAFLRKAEISIARQMIPLITQ